MDHHRSTFDSLADHLQASMHGTEVFLAQYGGEESDFVRLTKGKVRQAGSVHDHAFYVELINGKRHVGSAVTLSGNPEDDRRLLDDELGRLRARLPQLPEDRHLLYSTEVRSTERVERRDLLTGEDAMAIVLDTAKSYDLVGIYAAGAVHRGFANSLGQRNWFSSDTFNFEWTLYHHADKGIKDSYAGFDWDADALRREMEKGAKRLDLLARPPRDVKPGAYRAFLEPAAVAELMMLTCWGGFGLEGIRTKTSPLLHFWDGETPLDPRVNLYESTSQGTAPGFDGQGFIRPPQVALIDGGRPGEPLVSPRSALEYGASTNGANEGEFPESLEIGAGERSAKDILAELDRGLYLQRLWYLNWSDRAAARVTGMTRFASFWVEDGQLVAPLPAMRFDETLYNIFGANLLELTRERERLFDPDTYEGRTTQSCLLPGMLVDGLQLTL